jgi:hypothetical protein
MTSDSVATSGFVSNSVVPFALIDFVLNKLNTSSDVSVIVTVMVSAFPESSDTSMDLITEVVALGTVYRVVALVVVRSTFLLINVLAINLQRS